MIQEFSSAITLAPKINKMSSKSTGSKLRTVFGNLSVSFTKEISHIVTGETVGWSDTREAAT